LRWLYLESNQLSDLPAEIGNLTNVTWLHLSRNVLSNLPAEIGDLTNLTRLLLYNNQLSSLPAELVNLVELTSLSISDNYIAEVSADMQAFLDDKSPGWSDIQSAAPSEADITPPPSNDPKSLEEDEKPLENKQFLPLISN